MSTKVATDGETTKSRFRIIEVEPDSWGFMYKVQRRNWFGCWSTVSQHLYLSTAKDKFNTLVNIYPNRYKVIEEI